VLNTVIAGRACINAGELRCKAPVTRIAIAPDGTQTPVKGICNRLICKINRDEEIAGEYKCPKCGQIIEVVNECLDQRRAT
jgi:hypothetical protein